MRITFRAHTAAVFIDYALVCGVMGEQDQYLTFQRAVNGSDDDWGIHLEYRNQLNGGYNCIRSCRFSRTILSVDLSRPLGKLTEVEGFDVLHELDECSFNKLRNGLQDIFREVLGILSFD